MVRSVGARRGQVGGHPVQELLLAGVVLAVGEEEAVEQAKGHAAGPRAGEALRDPVECFVLAPHRHRLHPRHPRSLRSHRRQGGGFCCTPSTRHQAPGTKHQALPPGFSSLVSVTSPTGETTHSAYDLHGRKIAEWGATYPVHYGYDLHGRMTSLATLRDESSPVQTLDDLVQALDRFDRTTWAFEPATGLLLAKRYPALRSLGEGGADGHGPDYTHTPDGKLATRLWARANDPLPGGVARSDGVGSPLLGGVPAGRGGSATEAASVPESGNAASASPSQSPVPNPQSRAEGAPRLATRYHYHPTGELARIEYSDGTPTIHYAYDRLGRQIAVRDGFGVWRYEVTDAGQRAKETTPHGVLERQYDDQGRLAGISVPALDYRVRYAYDAQGRLAAIGGPDMGSFTYHFEPGSDLLATVSGPVHTVRHAYEPRRDHLHVKANSFNREWTRLREDATARHARMNANAGGRRTTEGTEVTEVHRGGEGLGVISQYTYDVDPSGRRVGREDLRPFVAASAKDAAAHGAAADPNPSAHPTIHSSTHPAIRNAFSYNARSEVIAATMGGDEFAYAYDAIGNRLRSSATVAGRQTSSTYTANALNQYTALVAASAVGPDLRDGLSHDTALREADPSIGSGQARSVGPTSATRSTPNETNASNAPNETTPPTYDLDGNMLTDPSGALLTWNGENRLARWERDGVRHDYAYDHQGRRLLRTTSEFREARWVATQQTRWVYDGWNPVAEIQMAAKNAKSAETSQTTGGAEVTEVHRAGQPTPAFGHPSGGGDGGQAVAGTTIRTYLWGLDLSGTLQGAGGVGGLLSVRMTGDSPSSPISNDPNETRASGLFHPVYDANGNVTEYVASANPHPTPHTPHPAAIAAAYSYDPFGNVTAATGPLAHAYPHRFSTKPADEASGWLYYGYRFYAPELGRWANRDPIGESDGPHLLAFNRNSPTMAVDSLGLYRVLGLGNDTKGIHLEMFNALLRQVGRRTLDLAEEIEIARTIWSNLPDSCPIRESLIQFADDVEKIVVKGMLPHIPRRRGPVLRIHNCPVDVGIAKALGLTVGGVMISPAWIIQLNNDGQDNRERFWYVDRETQLRTVFHELTHFYGSRDDIDGGLGRYAQFLERLYDNPLVSAVQAERGWANEVVSQLVNLKFQQGEAGEMTFNQWNSHVAERCPALWP